MAKKETKLSPLGEAKWAHIHEPKPPYQGKGDPKFEIDVVFEKGGEWDAIGKEVATISKENGFEQMPIKKEKDKEGEYTGRFFIRFKTGEQYPPKVFDKFGQIIGPETLVGNGSTVRVAYTMAEYSAFGGGITFYLQAVQVDDLVEYKGNSATDFGFPVEEGSNPFLDSKQEPDQDDVPF